MSLFSVALFGFGALFLGPVLNRILAGILNATVSLRKPYWVSAVDKPIPLESLYLYLFFPQQNPLIKDNQHIVVTLLRSDFWWCVYSG